MKRLHIFIYMALACLGLHAQEEDAGEQLLVFRNTGVVDLLYTNEVDSVVTRDLEQVFYAKDTVLVVPYAELDSVAIGNRNERQLNAQVHELTEERDLPWLIRVEENHLYYRQDTPSNILPKVGEKVFYGDSHELLPYGLTARVQSVSLESSEYDVEITSVELEDIFDKLFFTGRASISQKDNVIPSRRKAPGDLFKPFTLPEDLDFGGFGHLSMNGETVFTGDFVVDVLRHYYHAHIKAETEMGMEFNMKSKESSIVEFESPRLSFPLPVIAWVIHPRISLSLYTSAEAELAFNYNMKRHFAYEFDWTRKDGKQTCEFIQPQGNEPGATDDEAKMDLTLKGGIFLGARAILDLNLPGDRVGFRADMKFGPSFQGELGLGMLSSMRNYNPQLFAKSSLSGCLKLNVAASAVSHEHFLIFGNEVETPIYEHEFRFIERELDLFPQYKHTFAMTAPPANKQPIDVSVATAIEEPPLSNLETGFEIVDSQNEVVDSIFVGTIIAEPEDRTMAQTFDSNIVLPTTIKSDDLEDYNMRPVFHYAGYTISAAPVGIRKDVLLQPYSSTQSNGAMTFISSGPFLGSAVKDSIYYQVGAYLPVPIKNNIYQKAKDSKLEEGSFIDDHKSNLLIGTWYGMDGDETITVSFSDNANGLWQGQAFTYELNTPQTGDLLLTFDDDLQRAFLLMGVTGKSLQLYDKSNKYYLLLSAY